MLRIWQLLVGALVLFGLLNVVAQIAQLHAGGTFGFTKTSSADNRARMTVTHVDPGGPADKAGIKAGDVLTFAPNVHNVAVVSSTLPGDLLTVLDRDRPVDLTAVGDTSPIPYGMLALFSVAKIAFLLMGALIAWRRPDDPAARALAIFLSCFGSAIDYDTTVIPAIWARFASLIAIQTLLMLGALAFYTFANRFPEPARSGFRAFLRKATWPLAIIGIVAALASVLTVFAAERLPLWVAAVTRITYVCVYLLLVVGASVSLVISNNNARGDQRPRMRWVMGTFILGFSGIVVVFIAYLFGRGDDAQWAASTVLAIPFGLAYVILRHRVIDIGFVINRAVAYAVVSVVVVGAFIIFEWLLGHVVEANSRASTIIELVAALALGLSVRFIHTRVDRYVDDLFFRDRHLAEAAIRRFARETEMITDENVLIERTVEVAERNARLSGAALYARLSSRYVPLHSTFAQTPAELSENDEAILDMRTFHNPVDIGPGSAVPGAAAFPMLVRGQLSGFLACGGKVTHEEFAPDEHDALLVLARDAGIALDSLRISRIEQELAYLAVDGELPPELRIRLRSLLDRDGPAQPAGVTVRSIQ